MMTVVPLEAYQVVHRGPWVAWSYYVTKNHQCQKFPLLPGKNVCLLREYLLYKKKEGGMSLSASGGGCLKLWVGNTKDPGKVESPEPTFCKSDLGAGQELGNHRHTSLILG